MEARKRGGVNTIDGTPSYEADLPNDGVILTLVHTNPNDETVLLDGDVDADTMDAEAVWTPGETAMDVGRGFRMKVLSETTDGYQIEVTAPVALKVHASGGVVTTSMASWPNRACSASTCTYSVLPQTSVTLTATPGAGTSAGAADAPRARAD